MNILHSPVQSIRQVFDLMPRSSTEDWENPFASRMEGVGESISSYVKMLEEGIYIGMTASKRQTAGCIKQIKTWIGERETPPFFNGIVEWSAISPTTWTKSWHNACPTPRQAQTPRTPEFAKYLEDVYHPEARDRDAVGRGHYCLMSRSYKRYRSQP